MPAPWHVSVLIPARNEEELLPRCLRSVKSSISLLPGAVTCDLVVVVDSSTDRTRELAEQMLRNHENRWQGVVVSTEAGLVGRARALAADVALARLRGPQNRCWLANTDADCVVPAGWLREQLALAANHIEAVAGTVDVDTFAEHDTVVEERFRSTYLIRSDGSHPHVHGANLGVRADAYVRAGGWSSLATAEDHDLWNRLAGLGANCSSTSLIPVFTSGRRVGRAPHGFAQALAAHNEIRNETAA